MAFESLRSRMKGRGARILRLALLPLAAWSLLAWVAARVLVVRAPLDSADALVVLAGSSTYLERAGFAAQLFREGRAPKILLTNDQLRAGWSAEEQRNPLFVELAEAELRRQGVPAEKIEILPGAASSTHEEARSLREYARAHNLRSVLVVTSPYHSRRALWTLRRVFAGSGVLVGLDSPPAGVESPRAAVWWLYPLGWKMVPGEYVKLGYYMMNY